MSGNCREVFWGVTPENLVWDARWPMIARLASGEAGEPVHIDHVVAFVGQLWSAAARHDGEIAAQDTDILAVALGISDKAAKAIKQVLANKAVVDRSRLCDWEHRDKIRWCKTPEDLALHPRWQMIAESVDTRSSVIVSLMYCLWSLAHRNRGAVIDLDAKLFAHVFGISTAQLEKLMQALVEQGIVDNGVLIEWEWLAGGLTPGARRKRRYDRKRQRRRPEQQDASHKLPDQPSLPRWAPGRHGAVTTPLPSTTVPSSVLSPPVPPSEDSEQNSPLEPPVGGPAPGSAMFRIERLEILPPVKGQHARAAGRSPDAPNNGDRRTRDDMWTGQRQRGAGNQRSPRRSRRATASRDGPPTGGAWSRGRVLGAAIRRARPGPAEIDAYHPSVETLAWADANAPEIDACDPENVQAFRDHCRSLGRRFRDLDAGYRKWLRQQRDWARRGSHRRTKRGDLLNAALADMQGAWAR